MSPGAVRRNVMLPLCCSLVRADVRAGLLALALASVLLGGPGPAHAEKPGLAAPGKPGAFRKTTAGGLTGLALPAPYTQLIQDRLTIDTYQANAHSVAPSPQPSARPRYVLPPRVEGAVRIVRATLPPAVATFRAAHAEPVLPPRGFRAPILHNQSERWLPQLETQSFTAADREGARLVDQRLAVDGLIPTLLRILHALGPDACLASPSETLQRLGALGYPADLLQHFRLPGDPKPADRPRALVEFGARHLLTASSLDEALREPVPVEFEFQASAPALSRSNNPPHGNPAPATGKSNESFAIATECGESVIGLVRMQVGGGWRDGIVPGGSLDVISQMVDQFRSADFLISVGAEASASMHSIITNSWRLRRPGQVTLCEELVEPSAWAQDNAKAGHLVTRSGQPTLLATLVPRYACMDEGKSVFVPGESYLVDGLQAAGQAVVHSPLLFQGGNMVCVRAPRTGQRLLVLGESTLHRNMTLGLSAPQVLAALQSEFGVDECLVLPGLSYHLDFDACFRSGTNSELIAFVNDTPAAARHIVALGLAALSKHGLLPAPEAERLSQALSSGQHRAVVERLAALVRAQRAGNAVLPARLAGAFVSDPVDDAAGNLQVFLLAVDLLESALPRQAPGSAPPPAGPTDDGRPAYLAALRRMETARLTQIAALERLGCQVVPVPSMHDLYRSINYINGLQHRDGYVMPVFGGFYSSLDQAAAAAFRTALGPNQHIAMIRASECQRLLGGVHCTASVYPRP